MNDDKANLSNVLDTAHKTFQLTFNFRNLNIASFCFFFYFFSLCRLSSIWSEWGKRKRNNKFPMLGPTITTTTKTSNVPMNWNVHMLCIMHYFRTDLILTCWFLIPLNCTLIFTDYLFGRMYMCSFVRTNSNVYVKILNRLKCLKCVWNRQNLSHQTKWFFWLEFLWSKPMIEKSTYRKWLSLCSKGPINEILEFHTFIFFILSLSLSLNRTEYSVRQSHSHPKKKK